MRMLAYLLKTRCLCCVVLCCVAPRVSLLLLLLLFAVVVVVVHLSRLCSKVGPRLSRVLPAELHSGDLLFLCFFMLFV